MGSPFFQAWADWISGLNGPVSESSGNAKQTEQPGESLNGIGPESRSRKMSEPLTGNGAEQMELKFYDPSRTLMADGGIMENWKEQEVANALTTSSGGGTKAPAIVTGPKKYQPLRKLTEEQVEEAIRMYQSGLSLAKCAEPFGVSRQSMHDLLKRRIELRDRIEALPRLTDEERSKVQEKRNRALKRYRTRAKRITKAQLDAVKERDRVCVEVRGTGCRCRSHSAGDEGRANRNGQPPVPLQVLPHRQISERLEGGEPKGSHAIDIVCGGFP